MGSLARRTQRNVNTWPGFVDALATLLMVIIFLLMIFVVAQFFLNEALSGRDKALRDLEGRVSELADMLAFERTNNAQLRSTVEDLNQQLESSLDLQDELRASVRALTTRAKVAEDKVRNLSERLTTEKERTVEQLRQIDSLSTQVTDLETARKRLEERVAALLDRAETAEAKAGDLQGTVERQQVTIEAQETDLARQRDTIARHEETIALHEDTITEQLSRISELVAQVEALQALKADLEERIGKLAGNLDETEGQLLREKELSESARAKVALLNQQLAALRQQIAQLNAALEASEQLNEEQKAQIENLGQRLNAALATKVQELQRYRSEFFGELREVLKGTEGVRIVGDRFVFQSEVLFDQGSARLEQGGETQLRHLADKLTDLIDRIPDDIDWVLRVDGHTDRVPINNERFPSNWELSAARAISVVKFLIDQGLPPRRLVAAGFGEYRPIETGNDTESMRRNRRIELKLTQR